MGGAGGDGGILLTPDPADIAGSFSANGGSGLVGGNAFEATVNCTINTGSGAIWAGGGGAAGEQSICTTIAPSTINANARNGGSAAQGFGLSFGGDAGTVTVENYGLVDTGLDGKPGSKLSPGTQGASSGGEWGESGTNNNASLGGLSGYAIVSNGNTVTVTSGDNQINIKGRRI